MYPPDLSIEQNVQPFLRAMHKAGVSRAIAGGMLNEFLQNSGTLPERLTAVRDTFDKSKHEWLRWFPNRTCS